MRKLNEKTLSLSISVFWVLISGLELLLAFLTIGKKGITSFYVIETAIISLFAIYFIIYLFAKKKFSDKLLLINLSLLIVSMLIVFAQVLSPSLAETMPHKFLTIGSNYAICYRVDLLQGAGIPGAILNITSSFYIVNLNLVISTIMVVINTIFYTKRRTNYGKEDK